ncbi:hypothetical protein Tco_1194862 [Tanacetum coccineum]
MIENRISPDPDRTWVDGIRCATQIAPPSPDYVPGLEEPEQAPPLPEFVRCKRTSDLESGFYKDVDNLGPSYSWKIERIDLDVPFEGKSNESNDGVTQGYDSTPTLLKNLRTVSGDGVAILCDGVRTYKRWR